MPPSLQPTRCAGRSLSWLSSSSSRLGWSAAAAAPSLARSTWPTHRARSNDGHRSNANPRAIPGAMRRAISAASIAAAASRQGEPIESREALEAEFEAQLALGDAQRPKRWGGYVLEPDAIELWQHRDDRLHERFRFTRAREGWRSELLSP